MPYIPPTNKALSPISQAVRLSNQVVLSGTNDAYSVPKGIFFLEFLEMSSGTATIEDGDGNTIATGVTAFSNDHSPLRCDLGITITGSISMAKGFHIPDVFE
jgi:hypothetical protein